MKRIVFNLMLLLISMGMSAQRITRQYNNVSFSAALKDLNARQDKYVINFVYDELEDFRVTKSIRNQSVPDAIMQLIGFYPIKMTQMDNIIVVECTQKASAKMIGRIVDKHSRPVDFANVALLNVSDSCLITGGVTNENGHIIRKTKCFRILERNAKISKTKRNFSRLYPTSQKFKKIDRLRRNEIHLKAVRTSS